MIKGVDTTTIQALTFDLDDTLYDNAPVLALAEQHMLHLLQTRALPWQKVTLAETTAFREALQSLHIQLQHDLTLARWEGVYQQSSALGIATQQARNLADEALSQFRYWRNQITLMPEVENLLAQLRQHYPLIGVTNGNLDWQATALKHYFSAVFCSGVDGRAKPFTDLFHCARHYLNLPVQRLLHIGDSLRCDVYGAKRAGFMAAWLNVAKKSQATELHYLDLVDIELNNINELSQWLR